MNKFPAELGSIFKLAFSAHRRNTIKTSLLTMLYLILSILGIAWLAFFIVNYPLLSVSVGMPLMLLRVSLIFLSEEGSILLILVHIIGIASLALSLGISILYQRYLYLNTQNVDGKKTDVVFMPFSVFISALLTDVFLLLVSIVGLVFLVFPSFILTVRYKFVRLALISNEKMGFSKLVEVPNAFASSAKVVAGGNTVSTFLYLLVIFLIKHSALIILAILMFVVSYFVPGLLGGGLTSVIIWSALALWYIVFMAIGSYMYIVLYIGLSSTSHYGEETAERTEAIEQSPASTSSIEENTEAETGAETGAETAISSDDIQQDDSGVLAEGENPSSEDSDIGDENKG